MDKVAQAIIHAMADACRGSLGLGGEQAVFIGRLLAWHVIESKLPTELRAPKTKAGLGGRELKAIWESIANLSDLGELRYAFVDGPNTVPYERLSEESIFRANGPAATVILLNKTARTELASWVIDAIVKDRSIGMFELPIEVARFALDILQVGAGKRVLCPAPNIEIVAVAVMQAGAIAQIVGVKPPILASLFACIADKSFQYSDRDAYALGAPKPRGSLNSGLGVVVPPFGQRNIPLNAGLPMPSEFGSRSSEMLGVELALTYIKQKAVVVVPNNVLFKSGPERKLRENLVDNGLLEAVVSFPSGLLANTNLPFSLLVIRPERTGGTVKFCRADENRLLSGQGKIRSHDRRLVGGDTLLKQFRKPDSRTCIAVNATDIKAQDYSLVPDRFLDKLAAVFERIKSQSLPLGEIVTIVKPQLLPDSKEGIGVDVQEVSPGELPQYGYLERSPRVRRVDEKMFRVRGNQVLGSGDILLSTKGTIGKIGLSRPAGGPALLPSLSSVILRLNASSPIRDPRYLVMYLRSPAVQYMLDKMAVGSTIRNISLAELRSLPVWIPDLAGQDKIIRAFDRQAELEQRAVKIADEQQAVAQAVWRDTGLEQRDQDAA